MLDVYNFYLFHPLNLKCGHCITIMKNSTEAVNTLFKIISQLLTKHKLVSVSPDIRKKKLLK